jgi:hypothetical protein
MSQPIWITPAGSLGIIPENIFYQQTLRATTPPLSISPTCTATSSETNLITCTSTTGITPGLNVMFSGGTFGGINDQVRYFVLEVTDSTHFSISTTEFSTTPITLTNGTGTMTPVFTEHVGYQLIAGSLPTGIQVSDNGTIVGVPLAVASLQGVPSDVSQDVTSKFTIRAYTDSLPRLIKDRTFTLTVSGDNVPEFTTPAGSLGTFYDGDQLAIQIGYTNTDPSDTVVVSFAGGELPGGIIVSPSGLISGYIRPATNVTETPGYDLTPIYTLPYDFIVSAISKNYQFTLQVTDGKNVTLRTFSFFVYNRSTLTADNTIITSDNTIVTADETTERRPFIINAFPSNLGTARGDNYYAHQFVGNDYDTTQLTYAISINQGSGLPPGLSLDPISGWYYGYIPDQGVTEVDYSFNVVVYQSNYVGDPITCTNTLFGYNTITCNDTSQLGTGQPIVFTGTTFGGIVASKTQVYYVATIISNTQFTVSTNPSSLQETTLSTASGTMTANLIVASDPYPFVLTVTGAIDAEVTWITEENLGTIDNGAISLLNIEAVNRGGRTLLYRLKSGAFNELPQGLQLLPTGEIAGQVSFNTFAVDLGKTTFDNNTTTWDSSFVFTVNAYAQDTGQLLYDVESVTVVDGGSGYSSINTPAITFSTPVGASASPATAGDVTVIGGSIVSVNVANSGAGYTSPATVTIIEGFGGSGAQLSAVMHKTGVKDIVSVYKTFRLKLSRVYNKPYQNLTIQALPPANDREFVASLLDDTNIFVPEYIYRPDDANFGKAKSVSYQHAYGLAPDILLTYVESLRLNHYWKNLILGSINTAQALDPITGKVLYEVVYSKIVDDLVNNDDQSVGKIVNLAYQISDPADPNLFINQVYPNSLVDMRTQVIDVVGQISRVLPLWMTSKQTNGQVLGFTPCWVLCYTQPDRSRQIAYYIQSQFGQQLNSIDFKVDRYILNMSMSRNWDPATQRWTPTPSLTTFDRFNTSGYNFIGAVDIGTALAYSDVNNRTLEYINSLGGLDGVIPGVEGNTIIFVKQEDYNGPPGSSYSTTEAAWQDYQYPYSTGTVNGDIGSFDHATVNNNPGSFDYSVTVPGGDGSTVDERMAIYTISINPTTGLVNLTLTTQPVEYDFVQITRGTYYRSAQLYYPASPGPNLTRISWLPLATVTTTETIFDEGSMAFEVPVDMYDPTDAYDKYLVFPKANILE